MATNPPKALFDAGPFLRVPRPFNLADHTLRMGRKSPDKCALEVITAPGEIAEAWRFADLEAAIRGTMTGLTQAGLRPGDRLLLRLGHSVDFPILFFAATGLGALPVPTSPQWTAPEVAAAVALLTPRLTATAHGIPPGPSPHIAPADYRSWRALPPAEFALTQPDDPAYIVFTSGTGGTPKAVVHAHRAGWARRMMWRDWMDLRPSDRVLHAGAFNWTYTLGTGLTDPWAAGATSLIYAGPADRTVWLQLIRQHRATLFAAAPGVFRQMLDTSADSGNWGDLRHGLSAGDALPDRLQAAWRTATGTPIYQALGMSEVSTYASTSPHGAALRPQRGRRVAILDDMHQIAPPNAPGLLAVSHRDPGLMLGYWRGADQPPELPLHSEWFPTGDRARMTPDGALTHLGRADDLMNAQGYRVSPREVETVLLDHPNVTEAAVLEVEVRPDVTIIAAFVVAPNVTAQTLRAHCESRLARYKCPKAFYLRPALPRTATGKVLKRSLRDSVERTDP